MARFKNYMKALVKEEDGLETMEYIGLVAVAVILIGIITKIGSSMAQTANNAAADLDSTLQNLQNMGGG